ncbi:MAG TPA: DUF58 domain-containing protein [Longimicrobiales bacterium]
MRLPRFLRSTRTRTRTRDRDRPAPAPATPRPPATATATTPAAALGAVPREVLSQVKQIELRTRGLVNSVFSGEYQSVFRGQGMEFAEVREYQAGDDVRNIDWNVTARIGHPYVKKHVEERELTVMLLVDLSGSEQFGTHERFKAERAAEIAAVLALSAVRNNDRVGLLIFTDHVEHVVPPKKGKRHVLRIIRDVLAFKPKGRGTDIPAALDYTGRLLGHRSVVFVLSDFALMYPPNDSVDTETYARWERSVRLVAKRHDVVAVSIRDEGEAMVPDVGVLSLRDPETGESVVVDTSRPELRKRFHAFMTQERNALRRTFRRHGVDEIEVGTAGSFVVPLLAFFRRRERSRGR